MQTSTYEKRREKADIYVPQQRQIATGMLIEKNLISVVFTPPTYREDAVNGVDDYIDIERMKVAYRVRVASYADYWREGFTLRTSKKYGYPSELEKVMSQDASYADWMLYSLADEHEPGRLAASVLIDLKSVGAQLVAHPEILRDAHRTDYFVDLPYGAFPDDVVMGIY